MSAIFQHIAGLASSLSYAELRVLLDLAVRTQASPDWHVGASSREMAQSTGLARASVQTAIDSLNQRRLIRSDAGSATRSAIHTLLFCAPSGLTADPAANEESSTYEPRYKENTSRRTESFDSDIDKTIDRLQNAKKGDFDETLFEHARQQIASHHAKFARPENKQSGLPDDTITTRFLAVAEWPKLETIFYDLAAERKEAGHSYAY